MSEPDAPFKRRIAVDFDGVIHSYDSGWQGHEVIPDPPVPGAIEWLNGICDHYEVVIMSARASTPEACKAVADWLDVQGFRGEAVVTNQKPNADIYIDDRAWRFEGTFPTAEEIAAAVPWNKKASV